MRMYGEITFINLSVKFNCNTAFADCPTCFYTPKSFFDFQFLDELGVGITNDDFPDNRINGIGICFCSLRFTLSCEGKRDFKFVVHNAHIFSS